MNTLTADNIMTIVTEALERTAMVFVDPAGPDDAEGLAEASQFARIAYYGECNGCVLLEASAGFMRELCSSMLGVEPDEVDVKCDSGDALREFANIIGGSIILLLGGDTEDISLGLPESLDAGAAAQDNATPFDEVCHFDAMGERFTVRWRQRAASNANAA